MEGVLVEEQEVSAELMEPPVLEEGAPEEVEWAVQVMTQKNLMEVTAVVDIIRPVLVDAPMLVLEAQLEFLTPTGHTVADHWERPLAAALEGLRRLDWEKGDPMELVEPSVGAEEALGAAPEA